MEAGKSNRMNKSKGCCTFLLLSLLAGLHSGNGNVSKYACFGDSVKLIDNVSHVRSDIVVSIYDIEDNLLGIWYTQDGIMVRKNGQNERLISDKRGNIWIINLIDSDDQIYVIKTDIGNLSKTENVNLKVMAAPTKNCKPNIIRSGDKLIAELSSESNDECGRPLVSVYWLWNPGTLISRYVIQIHPGNEKFIYLACIKGVSLKCTNRADLMEHCSSYIQNKTKQRLTTVPSMKTSTELSSMTKSTTEETFRLMELMNSTKAILANTVIFIVCVISLIVVIIILYRRRKGKFSLNKGGHQRRSGTIKAKRSTANLCKEVEPVHSYMEETYGDYNCINEIDEQGTESNRNIMTRGQGNEEEYQYNLPTNDTMSTRNEIDEESTATNRNIMTHGQGNGDEYEYNLPTNDAMSTRNENDDEYEINSPMDVTINGNDDEYQNTLQMNNIMSNTNGNDDEYQNTLQMNNTMSNTNGTQDWVNREDGMTNILMTTNDLYAEEEMKDSMSPGNDE